MRPVLPTINALLNATATGRLIWSYTLIRRKRVQQHRRVMISAFFVSRISLVCYLVYHAQVGSVPFPMKGAIRTVYLGILATHTTLAAAVPAILTLRRGLTARFDLHGRVARWTLPIWLYVSVPGVAVYLMFYHL